MANNTGVADHKATSNATIPGMTVERTKAVVLLVVQMFTLAQTGLSLAGISQLPLTSEGVSTAITGVIAVIASIYSWWHNNNVTEAGVQGQQVVDGIKLAQRTGNTAEHPDTDTDTDTEVSSAPESMPMPTGE